MQDSGEWRRAWRQTLLTRPSLHPALEPNLHRPDRAQGSAPSGPAAGADRRCELVHCRDQLAANTRDHRHRANAAEPSLLAGLLVDARGERLTPAHVAKKGRRYRGYVPAALSTEPGADRAQGRRLAAREVEETAIRILPDALTSPATLVEPFGAASMRTDHFPSLLNRAARLAAA